MVDYKQLNVTLLNDFALLAAYKENPKFELYVNNNYKSFDNSCFVFFKNMKDKESLTSTIEFLKRSVKYRCSYVANYLERFMKENCLDASYSKIDFLYFFSLMREKENTGIKYRSKFTTVFFTEEKDRIEIETEFSFVIENHKVKDFTYVVKDIKVYVLQDMINDFPVAF